MKYNVFIYFHGCISSCNMLSFEAQGCRFIFEVVFNHTLALMFLLSSESGLHRATGPVHPWNIYIWCIAHEMFLIVLYVRAEWVLRNVTSHKFRGTVRKRQTHSNK